MFTVKVFQQSGWK